MYAPPAGEQLDLVGDAGTGRVDQPEDGKVVSEGVLAGAHHLLHRAGPPGPGLHGRVVGDYHDRTPLDGADAGDDAVGREVARRRVGEQRVLDEGAGVEEEVEPVAHEQLPLAFELRRLLLEVPPASPLGSGPQLVAHTHHPAVPEVALNGKLDILYRTLEL